MSLPPDREPGAPDKEAARKRVPFEQWRKVMLLGAFILLGNALMAALLEPDPPRWITTVVAFGGYGLLAVGFGIRMRSIKQARAAAAEKERSDPEGDR